MVRLVLASSSPRRRQILEMLGLNFEVVKPLAEEKIDPKLTVSQLVKSLALQKADSVLGQKVLFNALMGDVGEDKTDGKILVLAADTVVYLDYKILGKPSSRKEAENMLKMLSGRWHEVYGGVALVLLNSSLEVLAKVDGFKVSRVKFRDLGAEMLKWYLDEGEWTDKAGAYAAQGKGSLLIEKIDGCFFNVMGLSPVLIDELSKEVGVSLFA